MKSFAKAWALQNRVIFALLMREMQQRWGRRNLGFAWLFCEPLVFSFPVLLMWSYIGRNERGLPVIPFLWTGYMPILLFRHVTGQCVHVIRAGGALLYHRAVTPFDLLVARIGLEVVGNWAATALSFAIFHILGVIDWPHDPTLFMFGLFYMAWWSSAVALIIGAWSERSDLVEHIWPPISYMYLPVSGFMFLAEWLPTSLRDVALMVMPSLHCYEIIRGGLFGNLITVYYDVPYLTFMLSALTLLGLWLVHDVRRYLEFN